MSESWTERSRNRDREEETDPSLFCESLFVLATLHSGHSDSTFVPLPAPQRVATVRERHGAKATQGIL